MEQDSELVLANYVLAVVEVGAVAAAASAACSVPSYKLAIRCVETSLVPVPRSQDAVAEPILLPQQGE